MKQVNADRKRIAELETKVAQLEAIIMQLLEKIEILTHSKNSRNSAVPPSKDENRPLKDQSLRTKSDKKVGGHNKHEGTTLKMIENPDKTILHEPNFCKNCGTNLELEPSEFVSRRQIIDILPINPEYTEHQIFKKVCRFGFCNVAEFPLEVGFSISYGSSIQATIAYIHTREYLPFERMSEFFQDFCNLPPDNNGPERAIRNVKVKQKISGQFKTERGAQIYAIIRSVTETCIKNEQNILSAFKTIAKLQAE